MHFYTLNHKISVIKQLKVLKTINSIQPIVKKLAPLASKIILFGSSSRGENLIDSDLDLLIISNNLKEQIEASLGKLKRKMNIQTIILTESGLLELKTKDPTFYEQILKGINLWDQI
ncbi:MAG: nucleotidyltransferase domain-containing protein [Pseudomonadota bacterium]